MALSIGELVGYVDLDTDAAEKATGRLSGILGRASGKWGKILGGGAAAAGGLFAAGLVRGMSLEPGTDRVAAALALTEKQAARAGKVAGQVYADGWGESREDVNLAIESVMSSIKGMRKASESDLRSVTEQALVLSEAMGVDVGRAAQVAGQMVKNGMAGDASEAFDLLSATMSKVPRQLREDVLDATDEYGQFFDKLGMDGPQAMALLAEGADKGMYGIDKAGDAIKEFTIRATDMSSTSQEAYDAIGLDAGKMANALLAGGDRAAGATDKIVDGLLGIEDPADRANASIALFGTPLEDLGTKDIPKFLRSLQSGGKQLGDFAGATDDMGNTMSDNASGNLSRFTRKLETGLVNLVGGKVLPVVNKLSGKLEDSLGPAFETAGKAAGKVTGFLSEHETTAKTLGVVLAGLVAITAAHSAVMAVAAAGGMAKWLMSTKLISTATKVWAAVQWALNAALAANPLVLIGALLAAVAVALVVAYKKSDTFRAIVNKAFSAVKKVAGGVLTWLPDKVKKAIDFVRKHWRKILAVLGGPLGVAVALVVKHWDKIKKFTSKAIDKVVGFVTDIPGRFKRGLSKLGGVVSGIFGTAMEKGKDKVTGIGSTIVGWIKAIPGKLSSLGGRFASAGRSLLQGFIDGMKNAAGIISGIAGNVWDTVRGLLNGAIRKVNAALEFRINLPLGKSVGINPPDIPQLAGGGRATGSVLAEIGEGREAETVLPDSMLRDLLEKVHNAGVAKGRSGGDTGRSAPLIGQVVQSEGESADTLAERLWFKTRKRG